MQIVNWIILNEWIAFMAQIWLLEWFILGEAYKFYAIIMQRHNYIQRWRNWWQIFRKSFRKKKIDRKSITLSLRLHKLHTDYIIVRVRKVSTISHYQVNVLSHIYRSFKTNYFSSNGYVTLLQWPHCHKLIANIDIVSLCRPENYRWTTHRKWCWLINYPKWK